MSTTIIRRPFLSEKRPIDSLLGGLLSETRVWHARKRQRRTLLELTPAQLDDIGITREAALEEAAKPFWRD